MADVDQPPRSIRPESSYPRLISLAVHELRTPASVVGGYLRMLQRDAEPLTERQRKMIDEAAKSCARIVELIAELSDLGKLDSGAAPFEQKSFDVFALAEEVAGRVQVPSDREVRLELRGPAEGAPVTGDPKRLGHALDAIFRSILREQPPGRTVVAERRLLDDGGAVSALLIVAAEGGVQAAYAARPAAFDDGRGGLGLSLPIARRVVEAHGGRLWSPTTGDDESGKGATILVLPLE
jgi:signal transduction histidine kinase